MCAPLQGERFALNASTSAFMVLCMCASYNSDYHILIQTLDPSLPWSIFNPNDINIATKGKE